MSLASVQMSTAVQMNMQHHLTPADHKLINLDVADFAETISEFPEELKCSFRWYFSPKYGEKMNDNEEN